MDTTKINKILSDPASYSHFIDLLELTTNIEYDQLDPSDHEQLQQLQQQWHTCELFTFGTFKHYFQYQSDFLQLSLPQVEKLAKLSILQLANDHEYATVSIDEILRDDKYGLTSGLALLNDLSQEKQDIESWLYRLIIELVFQGSVVMSIDEGLRVVTIGGVKVVLDSFDSKLYQLRILDEENDIGNRSVGVGYRGLKLWFENKLVPLRDQMEEKARGLEQEEQQVKVMGGLGAMNTKKRKSPDNYMI